MSRFLLLSIAMTACAPNAVVDDASAEIAYLGLDAMVEKGLALGFDGFNSASSANIAPQSADGVLSGTLTVTGQVDQGASDNKGMRLEVALVDYADLIVMNDDDVEVPVTYSTSEANLPSLDLTLRNIPDGTLTGSLMGVFTMSGDLVGDVTLDLDFEGAIEDDGGGGTQRKAGSTAVTGTATSVFGVYDVDVTL